MHGCVFHIFVYKISGLKFFMSRFVLIRHALIWDFATAILRLRAFSVQILSLSSTTASKTSTAAAMQATMDSAQLVMSVRVQIRMLV